MDDDHPPAAPYVRTERPARQRRAKQAVPLKVLMAWANGVIEGTTPVTSHPRQLYDAGLVGVCVALLTVLAGQRPLDDALNLAFAMFAAAPPLLVLSYESCSVAFRPGPDEELGRALRFATWPFEFLASVLMFIGGVAFIGHTSVLAAVLFATTGFVALPVMLVLAVQWLRRVKWQPTLPEAAPSSILTNTGEE